MVLTSYDLCVAAILQIEEELCTLRSCGFKKCSVSGLRLPVWLEAPRPERRIHRRRRIRAWSKPARVRQRPDGRRFGGGGLTWTVEARDIERTRERIRRVSRAVARRSRDTLQLCRERGRQANKSEGAEREARDASSAHDYWSWGQLLVGLFLNLG